MKKTLLTLGTIMTVVAPVVAVVSCGTKVRPSSGAQTNTNQGTNNSGANNGQTGGTDIGSIPPAPSPTIVKKWRVYGRAGMNNTFDTKAEAEAFVDSNKSAYFLSVSDYWRANAKNIQPEQLIIEKPDAADVGPDGGIEYSTIQNKNLLLPHDGSLPKIWEATVPGTAANTTTTKYYATEQDAYHAWVNYDQIKTRGHDGIMTLFTPDGVTKIHDIRFSSLSTAPSLLQVARQLTWVKTETNNAAGNDVYTLHYQNTPTSYTRAVPTGTAAPADFVSNDLSMATIKPPEPDIKYTISDFRNLNPERNAYTSVKAQIQAAGAAGLPTSTITTLTTSKITVFRTIVDHQTTKCYENIEKIYDAWAAIKAGSETKSLVCLTDEQRFNTEAEVKEHIIKEVDVSVG